MVFQVRLLLEQKVSEICKFVQMDAENMTYDDDNIIEDEKNNIKDCLLYTSDAADE